MQFLDHSPCIKNSQYRQFMILLSSLSLSCVLACFSAPTIFFSSFLNLCLSRKKTKSNPISYVYRTFFPSIQSKNLNQDKKNIIFNIWPGPTKIFTFTGCVWQYFVQMLRDINNKNYEESCFALPNHFPFLYFQFCFCIS
jgi:hypothetical protein